MDEAKSLEEDEVVKDLRISRRHVLRGAGAIGMLGALSGPAVAFADDEGRRFRWDILTPDATVTPGGQLSAKASDGSTITMTGSGTFRPGAPDEAGALPPDAPDLIGKAADARAGFAVFRIGYSDGSKGVLCFSCMLPGSPDSVLEGITASMGFVDFWNSVTAPQTVFHLLRRGD